MYNFLNHVENKKWFSFLFYFMIVHAFTFIEIFISPYAEVEVMAFPPAYVCVCVSRSVVSNSLWLYGL